jgi:uncharacterized protein YifN (PemK superfamily)
MLLFQPKTGSVVYCDYIGFISPEMVKKRPVIVVSKHKHNPKLLTVVPISLKAPSTTQNYHVEMEEPFCNIHLGGKKSWVKCDMINVVSLERLHLVRNKQTGHRHAPHVGNEFLEKIKDAIRFAQGLQ